MAKTDNNIALSFNVIRENNGKFEAYDIMPYLLNQYQELKKKDRPITVEDCKQFIIRKSQYMWWGRCEYEIILMDWPCQSKAEKWDIHTQVMMNIDVITQVFQANIIKLKHGTRKNL